eukprot:5585439-Prymnesium_polylepis.2
MVNAPPARRAAAPAAASKKTAPLPDISQMSVVGMGGATVRVGSGGRRSAGPATAQQPGIGKPGARVLYNGASCSSSFAEAPGADGYVYSTKSDSHGGLHMPVAEAFQACVNVYCTSVAPCYALPWVRGEESHSTSSGFAALLPSGHRRLLVQVWTARPCRACAAQSRDARCDG